MLQYIQILKTLRKNLRKARSIHMGKCNACGRNTIFFEYGCLTFTDRPYRNDLWCLFCGSFARQRALIASLCGLFGQGCSSLVQLNNLLDQRGWRIYNTASQGTIHAFLKNCSGYVCSEFLHGVPPGSKHNDVLCQDLQSLTFPNESFDLVITEDVLEHIRRPQEAFRSICRVLKPNGLHIFTVPIFGETTLKRVDTAADEDIFIEPKRYHGDPLCAEGVLAYNDFGLDIVALADACGFDSSMSTFDARARMWMCGDVFVSRKK